MADGIIKPGRVDPGSWKKWLQQGLGLVWRSPLFWLGLMGILDFGIRYGGIFQPILIIVGSFPRLQRGGRRGSGGWNGLGLS